MSIFLTLGGTRQWRPKLLTELIALVKHGLFLPIDSLPEIQLKKILALQDQKRELAASIISADTGILSD